MATSIDLAALANLIQAQTTAIADFKDQQILLYTTTDPTVVVSDANGNPVTVPSYYATIGDNKATVDAMKAQVDANTAAIAAINTGDTTINASVTALQTQQGINTTDIGTLKTQMATVQANQTTDETNISTLQAQVADIQAGGTGNSTAITDLQSTVAGHTTAITDLQNQQATVISNITTLQTNTGNNADAITALQTQQTTNTNTIAAHTTSISNINDQIAALQTQQQTHDDQIATNTTNIGTNTTTLQTLQSTVATNTDAITSIESNVSTLQSNQATNTTAIGNVQNDMSTLQTSQADLQAASTQNTTDIGDLRSTVATLPLPGAYNPPYVSNRFFTQTFLDVNGRLLGGISRRTGKLWMNNGGWMSDRLDAVELTVSVDGLEYYSPSYDKLNAPTQQRWGQLFGEVQPSPTGKMLYTVNGGFRADTGNLELADGTDAVDVASAARAGMTTNVPYDTSLHMASVLVADVNDLDGLFSSPTKVGTPGMTSTQVASRVAAPAILLSVANRKILAAGASSISASKVLDGADALVTAWPILAGSPSQSLKGTLGGLHGTLTRVGPTDADLTFTPTFAPAADYYVGDNIPFIPEDAKSLMAGRKGAVIYIGRNNLDDVAAIKRDIKALVEAVETRRGNDNQDSQKHFVVVTPYAGSTDDNASANGQAVAQIEQWVAAMYPHNHFLSRQFLQNAYAGQGAADAATFFANGTIPTSYYNGDGTTLTVTAQNYLSAGVYNFILQKGW